jgi:hypothetical protein
MNSVNGIGRNFVMGIQGFLGEIDWIFCVQEKNEAKNFL